MLKIVVYYQKSFAPSQIVLFQLEEIISTMNDQKLELISLDLDQDDKQDLQKNIEAIPTVKFVRDNNEKERLIGYLETEELKTKIKALLI